MLEVVLILVPVLLIGNTPCSGWLKKTPVPVSMVFLPFAFAPRPFFAPGR